MTAPACEGCAVAETNPASGLFINGCVECDARYLANSFQFFEASQSDTMTPSYRNALQTVAGADWLALHARVKFHGKRISEMKGHPAQPSDEGKEHGRAK